MKADKSIAIALTLFVDNVEYCDFHDIKRCLFLYLN